MTAVEKLFEAEVVMAQAWAQAFYLSKVWRQQRLHVLRRDRYTCADCSGRAEEVHHIVPLTPGTLSDHSIALAMDNLVSLCFRCHQIRHRGDGDIGAGYAFDEDGQVVPAGA